MNMSRVMNLDGLIREIREVRTVIDAEICPKNRRARAAADADTCSSLPFCYTTHGTYLGTLPCLR